MGQTSTVINHKDEVNAQFNLCLSTPSIGCFLVNKLLFMPQAAPMLAFMLLGK